LESCLSPGGLINKKSLVAPILISIFAFIAVPVSVSAVTQRASEINVCVDWDTKEIKYSKYWEKCPAKHTSLTLGSEGSSAYEVAVANGFVGTVDEWLASLEGKDGRSSSGSNGATGATGPQGPPGADGAAGGASSFRTAHIFSVTSNEDIDVFYTRGDGDEGPEDSFWLTGMLVLDPGTYSFFANLTRDGVTEGEPIPSNGFDVCVLFTVAVDPENHNDPDTWEAPERLFTSYTLSGLDGDQGETNSVRLLWGSESNDRLDGNSSWRTHHSIHTFFTIPTAPDGQAIAVALACSQDMFMVDGFGGSEAASTETLNQGNMSATQISDGSSDWTYNYRLWEVEP
jgi:hypothetical protein